jgi:glycosyltransferase involved in cell wall biosynthesis
VVIPVRNQPGCLRWTLSSLAAQSPAPEDYEVVIVDDGSTDDTPSVAEEFRDRLPLRLVRNEVNRGRAAARNQGAAAADGAYLLFLDADSWCPADLFARHRSQQATRPDLLVMGSRVEATWSDMSRLAVEGTLPAPGAEDGDAAADLTSSQDDTFAGVPWMLVATWNMSISTEVFRAVGGFDDAMRGWGYEDNEFGYRVFLHYGREAAHFVNDPALVCYHLPHFRDWNAEWESSRPALPYMKEKFQHFDMEFLSHPPAHFRLAKALPLYARSIAHIGAAADPAPIARLAEALPAGGEELWIGHGIAGQVAGRKGTAVFDHAEPPSAENHHLLGAYLPYPDRSLAAVVSVDLWRMLEPVDLSAMVMEALRTADELRLVLTKRIGSDLDRGIGLISDVGYLTDTLSARYLVEVAHEDEDVVVLSCRERAQR